MDAYASQLHSPAGADLYGYLVDERGLTPETVRRFKLGAVIEPEEGDGPARGRISIPYLTNAGPVALRFRKLPEQEAGPKYWQPAGTVTSIFNVHTVLEGGSYVVVAEGEFDAMVAHQCGLPAVGIPGANAWKPHYSAVFEGFERVIICGDNDDKGAGAEFAEKVAGQVPAPVIFMAPQGEDLNSFYNKAGARGIREWLKVER